MISLELILTLAVGALAFYLYTTWTEKFKNAPPGPWGLPIVGYLPFIVFRNSLKVFQGFKKKYGKVFSLRLGKFNVVVINDYKLIAEAYTKDVFMGRPAFEVSMNRNHGQKRGILFAEANTWAEQRRFALRNLRVFGFGKQTTMESLLLQEADELSNFFKSNLGQPISLKFKFSASVLNSLWFICTGNRFATDDPDFSFCVNNFTENLQRADLTGVVFFFPWLLKYDLLVKGFWENFLKTRTRVQGLVRKFIEEHKETYDPEVTRDFVDALITQWKKTTDPKSSFFGEEGDLNMLLVLVDLFLAGAETTSSTLQWAMLYMMVYPEVQEKVQKEIDTVIGNSRLPSLEDKNSMIYTEATLNEVHRFCSMVPFAVYHSTMDKTNFAGYDIPKDTVVLANLRDTHHDKAYWGDPENFRPERFIDAKENKIIKHDAFMPFSTGKRTCLGDSLAKDTLFIFFTVLMQKYKVEKDPNSGPYSIEPNAATFIVAPKPYNVVVQERNV